MNLNSTGREKLLMDYKQRSDRIKFAFQKDHSCFGVEWLLEVDVRTLRGDSGKT